MTKLLIDKQVIEQALGALDWASDLTEVITNYTPMCEARTALRSALAESVEQEPVARVAPDGFIYQIDPNLEPQTYLYTHPAPAVPVVERLRDELASALEDLDREVKIGNDLMADNAKYREALEMARDALVEHGDAYHGHFDQYHAAIAKIGEVLK